MELHYCDVCQQVLKNKAFILVIGKQENRKKAEQHELLSPEDFMKKLNNVYSEQKNNTTVKEICPNCYKVLEHFFSMRIKELKKMTKEIQDTYRRETKKRNGNGKGKINGNK